MSTSTSPVTAAHTAASEYDLAATLARHLHLAPSRRVLATRHATATAAATAAYQAASAAGLHELGEMCLDLLAQLGQVII